MPKNKKPKKKKTGTPIEFTNFDDYPMLKGVIPESHHHFLTVANNQTLDAFSDWWLDQMKENQKNRMWKKFGGVGKLAGLAYNKAVIGVGSGPSLKKNIKALKRVHDIDGVKHPRDRDFIICAANHHFKPLIKEGIFPDFVFLADGSKIAMDQLCEDIPPEVQHCILITGFHCDPATVKAWTQAGREVRFYLSDNKGMKEAFNKVTGKNPEPHAVISGGNVLNTIWSVTSKFFGSRTFMGMGNDLSYPTGTNIHERRAGYYQDGDYSANMPAEEGGKGTGRDEARQNMHWMSFKITDSSLYGADGKPKMPGISGDELVGTSNTLWVYKTWLEEACLISGEHPGACFRYYNCTEGGILGVLAHSTEPSEMVKDENWFMLDEVCKRYHTTSLKYATDRFMEAKEILRWQNKGLPLNVHSAGGLAPGLRGDIVGAVMKL